MTYISRTFSHRKLAVPAGRHFSSSPYNASASGTLSSSQLKQIVAEIIG